MIRWRPIAAALVALPLAACVTVGPDYERPELPLPEGFSEAAAATPTGPSLPGNWWTLFGDPTLDRLVSEALAANQDLAEAAARVEEARALAGLARADQFPTVDATAGASRTRISRETLNLPPEIDIPLEFERFRAAADVFYELDFWGRLRRLTEAARAELLASEEGRRNVELGLVAEVATAWFDLLALDEQLAIVRETLGSRGESVRLQRLRFEHGTISELDLAQAEAELASAEATAPALERQVRFTEDRLAVLLGRIGGGVERPGTAAAVVPPEVPVGLPSALLVRRPDVLAAEQRLAAANARIGAARAAYFPSITLTGSAGSESAELTNLLGSGTFVWQAAAGLVQPIFNAGRTKRQVEAARARERQALAGYTRAVQEAFADVEDALAARRTSAAERAVLARQVEALSRARRLAGLRYEAGESSYLEVLDAERSLFRAELELSRARRSELEAAVDLMQALGGGWETAPPATPSP